MKRKYTIRLTVNSNPDVTAGDELAALTQWLGNAIASSQIRITGWSVRNRKQKPLSRQVEAKGHLVLVPKSALEFLNRVRDMPYNDRIGDDEFLDALSTVADELHEYEGPLGGIYALQPIPRRRPFQFAMLTAAYNRDHEESGQDEYPDDPPVKWTIENDLGVRVWMGALPEEPKSALNGTDCPSIVIERNTRGYWSIFVQPDSGEEACRIDIHDDATTRIQMNRYRGDVEELEP